MASFSFIKGAALVGLLASSLSAAPQYYLFNGTNGFQIDPGTGTLVNTFAVFDGGVHPAIVGNTIRLGSSLPGQGEEYSLAGTPTGSTFDTSSNGFDQWLDGTTDGTNNYAVECCGTNRVHRTDLWWENSTVLFNLPLFGLGITYDSASNTLWVGLLDGSVRQYTMAGVEVSSFTLEGGLPAALAYDAVSDTLWLHNLTGNTVSQYQKDGSLLQHVTIEGGWDYYGTFGGEIYNAAVPEPGTFGLLGAALAAAFVANRRRSS